MGLGATDAIAVEAIEWEHGLLVDTPGIDGLDFRDHRSWEAPSPKRTR